MNVKKTIASIVAAVALAGGVFEGTISDKIPDIIGGNEIVAKRTENSRTFQTPDGKLLAHVYTTPIHYGNPVDGYKAINDSVYKRPLLTAIFSKYEYETNFGHSRAFFDESNPADYAFERGDYSVNYTFLSDTTSINIETETNNNGVKQSYILRDKFAITELRWLIDTNAVMDAGDGGEIKFTDINGNFQFRIPKPIAWDANGKDIFVNSKIVSDTLIYELDMTKLWTYPLTVDPSTTTVTKTAGNSGNVLGYDADTYTEARDITEGTVGDVYSVGQIEDTGQFWVYRTFLSFDLSGLASDYTVTACSLCVNGRNDYSTTDFGMVGYAASFPSGAKAVGWFNDFPGWEASTAYDSVIPLTDTYSSASYSADWNKIAFLSAGVDTVQVHSNTAVPFKIVLLSGEDVDNGEPTNNEYIEWEDTIYGGNPPYLSIAYTYPARPPTDFTMNAISGCTDSIVCAWTDTLPDETGYRIISAPGGTYIDSTGADLETIRIGGLSTNTKYAWQVQTIGGISADSTSAADSTYTLAATPVNVPVLNLVANNDSLIFASALACSTGTGNPSYTEYAIQDSLTGYYIDNTAHPDTLATSGTFWATVTTWGESVRVDISEYAGKNWTIRAKAKSGQ